MKLPNPQIRRRDLFRREPGINHPVVLPNNGDSADWCLSKLAGIAAPGYARPRHSVGTLFRLRQWLYRCEKEHNTPGRRFQCKTFTSGGQPEWVIDVAKCCVVRYLPAMKCMALSYVWGPVYTAKSTRGNIESLQKEGSLFGPVSVVLLPKTVEDAVFLTGLLGVRYLWCDRLCIVQDDDACVRDQIDKKGHIFARASCSIAAKGSPYVDVGLTWTRSRRLTRSDADTPSQSCMYRRRGWTYHEELFSTRIIVIGKLSRGGRVKIRWSYFPLHHPIRADAWEAAIAMVCLDGCREKPTSGREDRMHTLNADIKRRLVEKYYHYYSYTAMRLGESDPQTIYCTGKPYHHGSGEKPAPTIKEHISD
ncbi:hypothetical protein B0H66DRAFT_186233 [Apodospora peruviana]|uniref:Heterokaryon incompatibility domain-containing protein n=1 Tax=Apodospora peruviana TaxID=516989 RepID=A0AAE0IBL1_9PEZI|nr:hypothetical protein B0H66DRAFT_186233 [Apodospora peruviana]